MPAGHPLAGQPDRGLACQGRGTARTRHGPTRRARAGSSSGRERPAGSGDPRTPTSRANGDPGYRVHRYDLALDYRPAPDRLVRPRAAQRGRRAGAAAPSSRLDLGRLPDRPGAGGRPGRPLHPPGAASCGSGPAEAAARPGAAFTVEVRYAATPSRSAATGATSAGRSWTDGALVASQPIGAPSWFPCNDRPADKAVLPDLGDHAVAVHGGRQRQAAHPHDSAPAPPPGCTSSRRRRPATWSTVQIGQYEHGRLLGDARPAGAADRGTCPRGCSPAFAPRLRPAARR